MLKSDSMLVSFMLQLALFYFVTKNPHFFIIIGKKTYGQRIPIVVILEHESTLENFVEFTKFVLDKVYENSKRIFIPYYFGE